MKLIEELRKTSPASDDVDYDEKLMKFKRNQYLYKFHFIGSSLPASLLTGQMMMVINFAKYF